MNRVEEAIALLKSVVAAEPKNADALINLGLALSQAHQARDAVPSLSAQFNCSRTRDGASGPGSGVSAGE